MRPSSRCRRLLTKLAADPENGIAEILDRDAITKRGAFPDAAFLVVFKPGYYAGNALSGSLITPIPGTAARMDSRPSIRRCVHRFSPWEQASRTIAIWAWWICARLRRPLQDSARADADGEGYAAARVQP